MKSRTSFCKLLLKDITRYAPLWGSWLGLLLCFYLRRLSNLYYGMTYPLFIYAGICAVTLFGDLYNPRRCYALHAMPLRRGSWFAVHALAGFLFFLVPTGVFFLATNLIGGVNQIWLRSAGALGAYSLEYLCFFGIALLCAMLAGTQLGAGLIYCAISFLAPIVKFLLQQLYQPFLTSIPVELAFFDYLSPVVRMAQQIPGYYPIMGCTPPFGTSYIWSHSNLGYFLICAGVGILAAGLALLLYRRRNLEKAGFFCVYPVLRYVFVPVFSLIAGVLMFRLLKHGANQYYFLFLYIPIFYIAAAMLVEHRFHVFRPGHILTLSIFAALLFNSLWIVKYDPFGILDYVPKASHVKSVEVYLQDSDMVGVNNFQYGYRHFREDGHLVVATEDIAQVTQAHETLLYTRDSRENNGMLYLTYRMKGGGIVRRYYPLIYAKHEDAYETLNQAVSTRNSVFGEGDWEDYVNQVYRIEVSRVRGGNRTFWFGTPENTAHAANGTVKIHSTKLMTDFLEALKDSCDEGVLKQLSSDDYNVTVYSRDRWGRECRVSCIIPHLGNHATPMLNMFWDTARNQPDRTIRDDTPLEYYDITFNPDGSLITIPRID